jgi:dihydroorotate dehydrogenase
LKIAPDLTDEQLHDIAEITSIVKLDGIVSSNTTISRDNLSITSKNSADKIGMGGLSGLPLQDLSNTVLKKLHQLTGNHIPIIGSGGIYTGKDAKEKMNAGASLVQVWTGFIYEGPGIVKNICKTI